MKKRVVVTGIGVVSSIGNNKDEILDSIIKMKTGIKDNIICSRYESLNKYKAAESSFNNPIINNSKQMDKIELMTRYAIDQAMNDSGISVDSYKDNANRVSLSFATSLAGNDYVVNYFKTGKKDYTWLTNQRNYINTIAKDYNIRGACYTTSTACASGTSGAGIGFDLIRDSEADIVIVGGADSLSEFSMFGFHALKTICDGLCKPFDLERCGINLGEASAFFIFEEYDHAIKRNAKIYCEVVGYGLANDAYHSTSPDPNGKGASLSIEMALNEANITAKDINYINAHGTATTANDEMEVKIIKRIFDNNSYVSSTKSLTGHCLGAAGSIELAICILAMDNQIYPKTYNSHLNIDEEAVFLKEINSSDIKYSLSNSFAFAGNVASIIIKNAAEN